LSLPELLYAARERKGVDLYRAERDTKIRAHYLAALERGDYRELPGAVYTKGFLRNYALYLGLNPDEVLSQWRQERGDAGPAQPVIAVPRPITAPRKGLTFSPAVVVAALMTVVVLLVGGYLVSQVMRFAKPPTLVVTDPDVALLEVDENLTDYTIRGTSIPGATVTVEGAGNKSQATADSVGRWEVQVDLRRGQNTFQVDATDPETGKHADTKRDLVITVPFLVIEAPTLTVDQPADGATVENGAIPVQGRATNATEVTIAATWKANAGSAGAPGASPGSAPAPTPAGPPPVTVPVAADGSFSSPLQLTTGQWDIRVTAKGPEGKTSSQTRTVTVAYSGVNLVVSIQGSRAWLKVWIDGKVSPETGSGGKTYGAGKTLTFTARQSIEVRTGKASATYFTLNGRALGQMSKEANPGTWLFAPPAPPEATNRR
jgi:cytoskeletal protein RodZ